MRADVPDDFNPRGMLSLRRIGRAGNRRRREQPFGFWITPLLARA
jgi:hypothetical protein